MLPLLMGMGRVGAMALRAGAGVAKSGLRAAGTVGKAAAGYGIASAMSSSPQQRQSNSIGSNDNVRQFPTGNGVAAGQGATTPVTAGGAVSSLPENLGNNKDIIDVLEDIKKNTLATVINTTALVSKAEKVETVKPPQQEVKGGQTTMAGKGKMAAGIGGIAGLMAMGLDFSGGKTGEAFDGLDEAVEKKLDDVEDSMKTRLAVMSAKLVTNIAGGGTKFVVKAAVAGGKGLVNAAKATPAAVKGTAAAVKGVASLLDGSGTPKAPKPPAGPLTKGGRPDMRFKVNKEAAALANIPKLKVAGDVIKKIPAARLAKAAVKGLATFGAKMVPAVGALAGAGMSIKRLLDGDMKGAMAEGAGIFLPSVAGMPLDIGLLARDMYNDIYGNPDAKDKDERLPHDIDLKNQETSGYLANYGQIKDYAAEAIQRLIDGMSGDDGTVDARPTEAGTFTFGAETRKNELASNQKSWDDEHGATHNEDGTSKMSPQLSGSSVASPEITPAPNTKSAVTIAGAQTNAATAQSEMEQQNAQFAANGGNGTGGTGGGGAVVKPDAQIIAVYKDTSNHMTDERLRGVMNA